MEEHSNIKDGNYMLEGDQLFDTYFPKLMAIAASIGWNVEIGGKVVTEDGLELWGYTDISTKTIDLSMNQTPNNFIHTFIHELSHAMQPMKTTDPAGQVFAETVACIVTEQLGVVSAPDSFAFVEKYENHFDVLDRYQREIDKLVQFFLSRLQ